MGLGIAKFLNTVTHFANAKIAGNGDSSFFTNTTLWFPFNPADLDNGLNTEAQARFPINGQITITRIKIHADFNDSDGTLLIGVRDDGVTAASVTLAPASFDADSGPLAVVIAGGSQVAIICTRAGRTIGSWDDWGIQIDYQMAIA